MKSSKTACLVPLMCCFFVMGFVDLVGIASNYMKASHGLNDATANILPSLVFFWFLLCSVPTGMLMNRIGKKRTTLASLVLTVVALALPLLGDSFVLMVVAFSLLGIGNALLQVALNPLVALVVGGKQLASTLTFGQFIKAIASFLAPYLAMWGAVAAMPTFGLGWRGLFAVYLIVAVVSAVVLGATPIAEAQGERRSSSFADCFRLLQTPVVLLSFVAIACHVGIDVGTNTTVPKVLMERLGLTLNEAAFATSLYFVFRTVGSLAGSLLLKMVSNRWFYLVSTLLMLLGLAGLAAGQGAALLYVSIALVGLGNSNIFSLVYARAITAVPDKDNEVSGLMIMGLFGGTVFPLLMGLCADATGSQAGAVAVMLVGVAYLVYHFRNILA